MKNFVLILFCLLMSCGGTQQVGVDNTELTVAYDGVVEARSGGAYIDLYTLKRLLNDKSKDQYFIFSDDMCGGCTSLKKSLRERNWIDEVNLLNLDDKFVQELAGLMQVRVLPTMVVEKKNDSGVLIFEGPAEIMMYLARKL